MKKLSRIFLLLSVCLAFVGKAQAEEITAKIQEKYKKIDSFKTEFTQTLTNAASGNQDKRKGKIYYKRPGLIRWETKAPEKELIIVDEKQVWDYFPAEETVYKYDLSQKFSSRTMLKFITGKINLSQDFKIEDQGMEKGWKKLRLVPKNPEPNLVLAYIWIEPQSYMLRQVLLVDFFGNGNQLRFEDLKLNLEISDEKFVFELPEGVEVLEGQEEG